jgi:hypothetical protein
VPRNFRKSTRDRSLSREQKLLGVFHVAAKAGAQRGKQSNND